MIEGYLNIKEIAEKWNVTPRRVRAMCQRGQIEGVAKLGREWAIPVNTIRPADGHVTTREYKTGENQKHNDIICPCEIV